MERPMDHITTDQLEQRLLRLESVVAAARSEQAEIAGELDARQIPLADGCRSLPEWLAACTAWATGSTRTAHRNADASSARRTTAGPRRHWRQSPLRSPDDATDADSTLGA